MTTEEAITNLEYTIAGIMHAVDKWLEGDELKQDAINRAATMREKVLKIVEGLQAENSALREQVAKATQMIDWIDAEFGRGMPTAYFKRMVTWRGSREAGEG